jgi:hypothetical protein
MVQKIEFQITQIEMKNPTEISRFLKVKITKETMKWFEQVLA